MKGTRKPWKHHSRPARRHEHKGSGHSYLQRNSHSCCVKSEANHRSKEIPIHTSARGGFGFRLRSFRLTKEDIRSCSGAAIWSSTVQRACFSSSKIHARLHEAKRRTCEPIAKSAWTRAPKRSEGAERISEVMRSCWPVR